MRSSPGAPAAPLAGATVVGWRFEVVRGRGLRGGVRALALRRSVRGPGVASALGGSLELHWSDGLLTRAPWTDEPSRNLRSCLDAWRADAVRDRHGGRPRWPSQHRCPTSRCSTRRRGGGDCGGAATILGAARDRRPSGPGGRQRVDAVMRSKRGERTVATSRGRRADWAETSCTLDLWADEIAGASCSAACRAPPIATRLARGGHRRWRPGRQASGLPRGARGVLFMPAVVQALMERAAAAESRRGARSATDGRRSPARTWRSPEIDAGRRGSRSSTRPAVRGPASAPCSPGRAGRVALIAGGRLPRQSWIIATAEAFGMPPTRMPRGPRSRCSRPLPGSPGRGAGAARRGRGSARPARTSPKRHGAPRTRWSCRDAQVVAAASARGRCAVRLARIARSSAATVDAAGADFGETRVWDCSFYWSWSYCRRDHGLGVRAPCCTATEAWRVRCYTRLSKDSPGFGA